MSGDSLFAHALFHAVRDVIKKHGYGIKVYIEEYIKQHQHTIEKKPLQNPYPNFIWVSQEQRIAYAG